MDGRQSIGSINGNWLVYSSFLKLADLSEDKTEGRHLLEKARSIHIELAAPFDDVYCAIIALRLADLVTSKENRNERACWKAFLISLRHVGEVCSQGVNAQ